MVSTPSLAGYKLPTESACCNIAVTDMHFSTSAISYSCPPVPSIGPPTCRTANANADAAIAYLVNTIKTPIEI